MMQGDARIPCFDIAKGIGILLVFLGHAGIPYGGAIYSFHMPLFFLISGYFLSSRESFAQYAARRTKRLALPYLLTALAGTAGMVLYAGLTDCGMSAPAVLWERALANLYGLGWDCTLPFTGTHIESAGVIWFLPALLLALLTVKFCQRFEYPFLVVLVVSTLACISVKWAMLPMSIQAGLNASLFAYIGYAAGVCGFIRSRVFLSLWSMAAALAVWAISVAAVGSMGLSICSYSNPLVNIIAAVCMSGCVMRFSMLLGRAGIIGKVLAYLGANTLFLFCFHAFMQAVLWDYSPEFHIHPITWESPTACLLSYVLAPIAALLLKDGLMRVWKRR